MTGKGNRTRKPKRALAHPKAPQAEATDYIRAIGAPQRRRILRVLQAAGEARSPNEIAQAFGVPVGQVSYHVKVLKECGVIALTDTWQKRGAVEHFYVSTVMDNELVVGLLDATRADDESLSTPIEGREG